MTDMETDVPEPFQVTLMTYVIMPRLTPLIARFIYPSSKIL